MKLVKRKSDGELFEPSIPDDYGEGQALADTFSNKRTFYFRRIRIIAKPWYFFWKKYHWKRTGEIWEPSRGNLFDVIDTKIENIM